MLPAHTSKSNLSAPALLVIVLAVLGVGSPVLNLSHVSNAQPVATRSPATNLMPSAGAWITRGNAAALLDDFFDNKGHQWSADDARNNYKVAFLIATLPEPASPPLRYEFDAFLDAIQLAMGRDGYVLDSFDLPELRRETSSGDSKETARPERAEAHCTDVGSRSVSASCRPGILLFRRDTDRHLMVLFLVSEAPTRGVDKIRLFDALDQIAWLVGWKQPADPSRLSYLAAATRSFRDENEIRIVGPSFSGSAVSIHTTLDEWFYSLAGTSRKVRIISGTATSVGDELKDPRISFSVVRIPDPAILSMLVYDLRHGIADLSPTSDKLLTPDSEAGSDRFPEIAILSDNTAYGRAAVAARSIRRMAFPLHISDLRTAYSRIAPTPQAPGTITPRSEIPIVDETGQDDNDTVPRFSARTAAYNELVLETMLETINREHIRYVGLVATDVEDLVFLVHRIRDYCPNSIIFTTSSDLRFLRSDATHDFDGVLVFSTYPLFTPGQEWSYPFGAGHIQFPGEDAEGIFNATLAILDRRDAMVDYSVPFAANPRRKMPPLWVGVVGNTGIWPLAFQTLPPQALTNLMAVDADGSDPMPLRLDLSKIYSTPVEGFFFVLSLLCLIPCYLLLKTQYARAEQKPDRPWTDMLMGDAVLDEFRRERWMRISAFIGAFLMTYFVAVAFLMLPLRGAFGIAVTGAPFADLFAAAGSMSFPAILACVLGVVVLLMLIAAQSIALTRIRTSTANLPNLASGVSSAPTGAIFALIGTGIGLVLVGVFVGTVWFRPAPFAVLNFMRAANLGSSVSPLKPLLFLTIANICLIACDIWQLSLLEDCRIELPFLGFEQGGESFRGTSAYEQEVVKLLESPPWALPGVHFFLAFSLIGLIAFVLSSGWPPIHSIDGAAFDVLFALSSIYIYTYFSILLLRFVLVWTALHKLLCRLYWHPTRSCYETLRVKSLPERPEDQRIKIAEPATSLTAIEFCLDRARAMLRMSNGLTVEETRRSTPGGLLLANRDAFEAAIRSAERCLNEVLEAQNQHGWRKALGKRIRAQQAIEAVSRRVVAILEPAWRLGNAPTVPALDAVDAALLELGELFIASRVVDFLRHVFTQLRSLAGFAMAGVLAMMLAVSTYPLPNHNTLLWLSWVVLLSVIALTFTVFVSINRDRVVSMLSGTQPGRFNWDSTIVARMLLYGAVPILALLGAQVPGGLGGVVTWLSGLFGGG
jgi:hypothetical protein